MGFTGFYATQIEGWAISVAFEWGFKGFHATQMKEWAVLVVFELDSKWEHATQMKGWTVSANTTLQIWRVVQVNQPNVPTINVVVDMVAPPTQDCQSTATVLILRYCLMNTAVNGKGLVISEQNIGLTMFRKKQAELNLVFD